MAVNVFDVTGEPSEAEENTGEWPTRRTSETFPFRILKIMINCVSDTDVDAEQPVTETVDESEAGKDHLW